MELILFPHGLWRSNWVVRLGGKYLHLLSSLTYPEVFLDFCFVLLFFSPSFHAVDETQGLLHAGCVTTELHRSTKLADLLNNLPKATELV